MNHLAELLPALPASFNILTTFGALLAAGIIGARLFVRTLRLPMLSAWVLTGFILGPAALGLVNQAQLTDLQPLVDIGLALILFQLGRRLDVGWLLRERWLAFTSLAIAIALFAAVAVALGAVGLSVTTSLLIAALTLAVSPATLLLTIRELRAEGVVSERALNQTALIHLLGWLALGVTLAGWQAHSQPLTASLLGLLARSVAALLLGLFTAWLAVRLADWLGKLDGYQPVILVALVTVTMGICSWLGWPAAVALLVFGSATRRLDRQFALAEPDLLPYGRLLYVALFVLAGAALEPRALAVAWLPAVVVLVVRLAVPVAMMVLLARPNGVDYRQGVAIGVTLWPVAGAPLIGIGMVGQFNPVLASQLAAISLSILLLSELLGPIVIRQALRVCKEHGENTR